MKNTQETRVRNVEDATVRLEEEIMDLRGALKIVGCLAIWSTATTIGLLVNAVWNK
jgi:hypothetical protein